ncbi:hypothetical protein Tco_0992927 [Tanacetum coccineum]|uniref:Uncharacterized protein n=1 Tax=Tanacetum coccineum TaxID=301880 RepID=A0ABQ5F469_9ASTR
MMDQASDSSSYVMQDILQVLDYTCYEMGPTAVADNANVITAFAEDAYHNLQDDDFMKNTFNSGRKELKTRSLNPAWSQLSQVFKITTVDTFSITVKCNARLTPPVVPVPTEEKAEEMIYKDIASTEEIEKLVEESENVDDSSPTRHNDTSILGTRLEPKSDRESLEVEIVQGKRGRGNTKGTERRANGKNVKESRDFTILSPTSITWNLSTLVIPSDTMETTGIDGRYGYLFAHLKKRFMPWTSSDQLADNLHDVMMETDNLVGGKEESNGAKLRRKFLAHVWRSSSCVSCRSSFSSVPEQQHQLYLAMKDDPLLQQQDIAFWLALQMKFKKTQVPHTACRPSVVRTRDQDVPKSSSGQDNVKEPGPSTSGNQEQDDEFDFWTNSYASDDDEIPTKKVSQDIMEEISLTMMIVMVSISVHQEFSDMRKSARFSTWNRKLSTKDQSHCTYNYIPRILKKCDVVLLLYLIPVHGIIYKNSKKEKRVMRHSEIHKFCDATLMKVLEGLKSYNNDVKYGYVQKELTSDEVEYLKLFEEEIKVRLKYRNQMRRWEMYINGRPLGPRRERPE